jgi:hypothetical protein
MRQSAAKLFSGLLADLLNLRPSLIMPLIIVFALAIRLFFFFGMGFSDDLQYSHEAWRVATGTFHDTRGLLQMRLGVILPIALFYRLFGVGSVTLVAYSLCCSLGLIVLVFMLGKMFFSEREGLLASLLLAIFPLDVAGATSAMPDVPQAFFISLAIYHFMGTYRRTLAGEIDFPRNLGGYFITGLIAGFAYFIRDIAVLIFPFLAIFLIVDYLLAEKRENLKEALYRRFSAILPVLAGFMVVVLIEGWYHYADTGDFFLRCHIMSAYYSHDRDFFALGGICQDLGFYPREMFHVTADWRFSSTRYYPYGLFYYTIIPALLYVLFFHFKRARVPLIWALFFFIYLQFGSMSLINYIPVHRLPRHLAVITAPALLFLSFALTTIYEGSKRRGSRPLTAGIGAFLAMLVGALIFSSLYMTALNHREASIASYDARKIYEIAKEHPGVTVYTDSSMLDYISFLSGYKECTRFSDYSALNFDRHEKRSIIVLNASRGVFERPDKLGPPPAWRIPGKNWTLLEEIDGPHYGIWAHFNPKAYMVIDE